MQYFKYRVLLLLHGSGPSMNTPRGASTAHGVHIIEELIRYSRLSHGPLHGHCIAIRTTPRQVTKSLSGVFDEMT